MSVIHAREREITIKVVYYGPGLGGKTTSLQAIHRMLRPDARGQLVSLATGVDRTLYFDFLPIKTKVRGYGVRVQLYTVPGQVHYNSTRKLVLNGADGVVWVADSQRDRHHANIESLGNLEDNLSEQGQVLRQLPFVVQWNKRDAPDALPIAELMPLLDEFPDVPTFETVATLGTGVFDALKEIVKLVLRDLARSGQVDIKGPATATPPQGVPVLPSLAGLSTIAQARAARRSESGPTPSSVDLLTHEVEQMRAVAPGSPSVNAAIERFSEGLAANMAPAAEASSHRAAAPSPAGPRSLTELLRRPPHHAAVLAVERDIDGRDWTAAVRHAGDAFRHLAAEVVGAVGAQSPNEAETLTALVVGMPAARLLRFRETQARCATGGLSSEDALFALLFLVDVALRVEDLDPD
ncbi:MAG TPA: hypothetical protein VML75_03870 [Kofleriaceae bacterium]|nr:hypothetical protein [Kofleriaceae bacterium]